MYDEDTRKAYSALMDYIESKYDDIKDNDDFKEKFEELLKTDEEFQNMINEFNAKSVYNEDAVNSADDFLALGGKIFPAKEKSESVEETTNEFVSPKVSRDEVKPSVTKPRVKVPFYKKAINFVNSMPDSIKIVNVASLGVFATLEAFNLIGGGGLAYVGAVIGLPIPIITATAYAIPALYKSYKYGKLGKWLKGNKKEYEPLPSFENAKNLTNSKESDLVNEENKDDIYFPMFDELDDKEASKFTEKKVEPFLETTDSETEVESTPVETEVVSEPVIEEKPVETYNPKTDVPKFEKTDVKPEVVTPVESINPTNIHFENNEYDEPVDNVTYDPSDFDFVKPKNETSTPVVKEEYKPRHLKQNMQNVEEGYKEKRITELENELQRLEDVKRTLNSGHVFREDDDRKALVERMIKENSEQINKYTNELNELKGIKEYNTYELLKSRKEDLSKKLKRLADTPENKKLRGDIKVAIGQINRYLELTAEIKDNKYARDEDRSKLAQAESIAYTTSDYVWNDINGYDYVGRRKGK